MNIDYDPAPRLPISRGERVTVTLLGLAFLALLVADLVQGFDERKLSVVFVIAFWVPLLALHELGHLLAARLLGGGVTEIAIGFGRELRRFQLGSTRLLLRVLPVEGHVVPSPSSGAHLRIQQALIYFAGPLTNLLVLGLVALAVDFELQGAAAGLGRVAIESLGVTAAVGALCTLFPYRSRGNPSDGLGILQSCFAGDESFRRRLSWPFITEIRRLLMREQFGDAEPLIAAGLERHPDEPELLGLRAVWHAANGRSEEAYALLEELGPPDTRPAELRADLLGDAAWAVLFARDHGLLPDAERAAERALELVPGDGHLSILVGRIHLERGHPHEAYACLMRAYKHTRDVDQEAQCIAYLALACQALRGSPDAREVAAHASRFEAAVLAQDVPPALRRRVLESQNPTRD